MLSYLSGSLALPPHGRHNRKSSADAEIAKTTDSDQQKHDEMKRKILLLWKTVWDGLYQTHSGKGAYHMEELHILYLGAGMSSYLHRTAEQDGKRLRSRGESDDDDEDESPSYPLVGISGVLSASYNGRSRGTRSTLEGLKWYDEASIETLEVLQEILEHYTKEIPKLEEVYGFLRTSQLPLEEPTREHEDKIVEGLKQLQLDGMGRRLRHYGARLGVLGMDMEEEVRAVIEQMNEEVVEGTREGKKLDVEYVLRSAPSMRDLVYPRLRRKGSMMFSGSGVGL